MSRVGYSFLSQMDRDFKKSKDRQGRCSEDRSTIWFQKGDFFILRRDAFLFRDIVDALAKSLN